MIRNYSIYVVVLLLVVSFSSFDPFPSKAAERTFTDLTPENEAKEEISYLVNQDIIGGYPDGTFRGEQPVSRAEAATMLIRLLDYPVTVTEPTFQDVRPNHYARGNIAAAEEAGLITGYPDGTFRPDQTITKAEMTYILSRAFDFGQEMVMLAYDDIPVDYHAYTNIQQVVAVGLMGGTDDGSTFSPNHKVTRADFSQYLARALKPDFRLIDNDIELHAVNTGDDPEADNTPVEGQTLDQDVIAKKVITVDHLNVRQTPDGEVVGQLDSGDQIEVYGTSENEKWLEVSFEGDHAYIHRNYVREAGYGLAAVTSYELPVRQKASTDAVELKTLSKGELVDVYEIDNRWVLVKAGETWGYVQGAYLEDVEKGLKNRTIVLDPGHGNQDPGAVANGLREKEINLDVALKLKEKLEEAGADVKMTRDDDTFLELKERVSFAVDQQGDAFLSIHANAASESVNGTETFYYSAAQNGYDVRKESRKLTEAIHARLMDQLDMFDRGVKTDGFYVIKYNAAMPSSLVELGFLTNEDDAEKLKKQSWRKRAVDALYLGFFDYFVAKDEEEGEILKDIQPITAIPSVKPDPQPDETTEDDTAKAEESDTEDTTDQTADSSETESATETNETTDSTKTNDDEQNATQSDNDDQVASDEESTETDEATSDA